MDSFRGWLRTMIPKRQAYYFKGYANRLSNVADFRRLAKDSLLGRTGIRPTGREFCTNVWLGENTGIAKSVRIVPPAYIGRRCRVAAACIISGASNIEQQCEIDCGTIVDDSCILAGSYVGAGLNITGGVVCQETFFHLRRDVQLQFHDNRLFGKNLTGWDHLIAQMQLFVP
jgi:NDP-sugar pyrophosphorylase family protein